MADKEKDQNSKVKEKVTTVNGRTLDSYLLTDERKDKIKTLMEGLPEDSFIDVKKDRIILVPMHPSTRDSSMNVLNVLMENLSNIELAQVLLKCNTPPEEWKKQNIEFNQLEAAIYFMLEMYHSIGYYAMDQNSTEIIKDEKLYSDVSKVVDESVISNKENEDKEESNPEGPIVVPPSGD